jgi:hypothetical protein
MIEFYASQVILCQEARCEATPQVDHRLEVFLCEFVNNKTAFRDNCNFVIVRSQRGSVALQGLILDLYDTAVLNQV